MKIVSSVQKYLPLLIVLPICLLLMAGCKASPTTSSPPSGGELATYQMEIDLLGAKHEASVDSRGRLQTSVQVTSADDTISLSIDRDTILLDKNEEPLQFIQVAIDPTLPLPPEDAYIVGAVYDLTPQGAAFDPPLKLTISYDPEELPAGVWESDIYIACYENGQWDMIRYKQVDTERHRVTTQIDHFARYAVLAPLTPNDHPPSDTSSIPADRVEVVYFHRPRRCSSCLYAETATRFTVETYFEDELASGKLVFRVVNLGDEANAAIVEQYGAYTSSLFINGIKDGVDCIEEVNEIWFLVGKDKEFVSLVKSKIEKHLSGES